jgi:RNA polymerase sigma-70 factor (ECF subfamily)
MKRHSSKIPSTMRSSVVSVTVNAFDENAARHPRTHGVDPGNDTALLERFVAGDDRAFLELYRRHNPRLLLYAMKILGDRPRAEDVTQESWERLIALRGSTQQLRNPMGFLLRVARNLCIDALRARRYHTALDELHESAHPSIAPEAMSELESLALESLEQLPFEQREVLVLNYYCGYRFEEIATMLGKTPDAIWARASRGRARLRQIVTDAIAEEENRDNR